MGCKFEVEEMKLKAIKSYPTNRGGSCAKGMSQTKTIYDNRLIQTQKRESISDDFKSTSYDDALSFIASKIKESDPKRIGFYLSGQMLNEDYYVANKLAKGFVGTANCDTNSRTCMSSAVVGYKKSFGLDYVPVRIDDIEHCNLLILIGANPAEAHVVFFNQIKKAQKRGMKVVVIDPRFTMSANIADVYLPLKVGSDIDLLNLLAIRLIKDGKIEHEFISNHSNNFEQYQEALFKLDEEQLLKSCEIESSLFEKFYRLFIGSKNIITAWTMGINQSVQGVEKNLAINNIHILTGQINKKGSGPFSLTGQPNAMGGREVGGLSTTLAVHLDYSEESCQKVAKFWNSTNLPTQDGLTAFEMIESASRGKLDILIVCHVDPVYHLPNRNFVEKAFKNIPLVVEITAYKDSETSKFSHIQIPALPFGQKEGTQTNMDRTLTRVEAFEEGGDILQDWKIFAKLGKKLGYLEAFNFRTTQEVFEEYQDMTKLSHKQHLNIFKADYEIMKNRPFVWGENLYRENQFFTHNKKANLFFVENKNLSEQTSKEYPFTLITGRIRDQWHSGSKTRQVKSLLKHKKLEFIEINRDDAKELGLKNGKKVLVSSKRGTIEAEVVISNTNRKTVFIPISHRGVNYLTDDKLDPLSKEPDYNHGAVKLMGIPNSAR